MSPLLKIFAGALMMVLGIFTSVTYSNQLVTLIKAGIGPLLILVGAFIVWLESDEWKVQREEEKTETQEFESQQTLQRNQETNETQSMETSPTEEIKQAVSRSEDQIEQAEKLVQNRTVEEVKEAVNERNDLNIQEVLQAEKNHQNRKTLVEYLERQIT